MKSPPLSKLTPEAVELARLIALEVYGKHCFTDEEVRPIAAVVEKWLKERRP